MPDTDIAKESSLYASGAAQTPGEPLHFRLPLSARAERLDKVLARLLPEHSRSRLQGWVEAGHVLVNDQPGRNRQLTYPGDVLLVWPQLPPESQAFVPEDIDFEVVDDSPDWVVVNKPAGLVTHPGAGNWHGTLLNGLLFRYPELATVARAGIVHRLDKDTSGLLVVARHERAQTHLVRQLQARSVSRQYLALVHGRLTEAGTVTAEIGRDVRVPVRMTVDRPVAPKLAITHYSPQRSGMLGDGVQVTEVACQLETGRTHQIRVHLASLRHPLVADVLYGGREVGAARRQLLHARALAFDDPATGRRVSVDAALAADFQQVLDEVSWGG